MSTFFAEFGDYVETILLSNEQLLILGDFNIHIDVAGDSDATKLSDFFESVGLQQHVEQYTHVQTMVSFCSVSSQQNHLY